MNRMKRTNRIKRTCLAVCLVLTLVLSLLTGCGGGGPALTDAATSSNQYADSNGSGYDGYSEYRKYDEGVGEINRFSEDMEAAAPEAPEAQMPTEPNPNPDVATAADRLKNAKLIYTGNLNVETTKFDETSANLTALVNRLGGYLEYMAVNSYGSDGLRYADYTIRIPKAQFQTFFQQIGDFCHVLHQTQGQENISESYYDTESRLATQQTKLQRLQDLLARAETIEDMISIESAISEAELAIEQLTGTKRQYDSLIDFSTITLSLSEVTRLSNIEEPAGEFWSRLGKSFVSGLGSFVNWIGDLILALAYSWTWLLLLVLVIMILIRLLHKKSWLPGFHMKKIKSQTKPDNSEYPEESSDQIK